MRLKKNEKEYKERGSRSRPSQFWSKSKGKRTQIAMPKLCVVRTMQESRVLGKFQRGLPRKKRGKISEWTFERLQEAYDKVASEDIDRLSIGQEILKKSTDFLRRIIAPVDGMGGATLSYVCPHCNWFPLEDYIWWVSSGHRKKQCSRWFAACGGQYD